MGLPGWADSLETCTSSALYESESMAIEHPGLIKHTLTSNPDVVRSVAPQQLAGPHAFSPSPDEPVARYRAPVGDNEYLDALLVNRSSKTLVVSLHGALDREKISLPRFERLRTLLSQPYNSLYFTDPALYRSERLTLAWYTGWLGADVPSLIAQWVCAAAEKLRVEEIIFVGSSGGGFASAQISSMIPDSLAIVFNPQTRISHYQPKGRLTHGRNYIRDVMPHLAPPGGIAELTNTYDWSAPLGDRGSLLSRYSIARPNRLLYWQNRNDESHWRDHYLPFRESLGDRVLNDSVKFHIYEGPVGHSGPNAQQFRQALEDGIAWVRKTRAGDHKHQHFSASEKFLTEFTGIKTTPGGAGSGGGEPPRERDRFALTREQLLADYASLSRSRGRAAEVTALRMRSRQFLDILAYECTGYADLEGLAEFLLAPNYAPQTDSVTKPLILARIGRVLIHQELHSGDKELGLAALKSAIERLPKNLVSRGFRKLLVESTLLSGDRDPSIGMLDAWPDIDRQYYNYLRAETLNPFTNISGGKFRDWLELFNAPFREYNLRPVSIDVDAKTPFDGLYVDQPKPDREPAKSERPLVSVILTTFRPESVELTTSVNSILMQTMPNFELIIVDDCSGSSYHQLLDEIQAADPRIRVVKASKNGGTYVARNIGYGLAKGEYVTGQDDDDWSHPERLAKQVQRLESDTSISGCRVESVTCNEKLGRVRAGYTPQNNNASSLMIRRDAFERAGGFLSARKAADTELYLRIEKITGLPIVNITEPLTVVRVLEDSLSRSEFRPNWSHPARRQFKSAYKYWHETTPTDDLKIKPGYKLPVAVPRRFQICTDEHPSRLDVVLAGDWRHYGGPQKSMLEEIDALKSAGMSVGVLHLEAPRFMAPRTQPLCEEIQSRINSGAVTEVLYDDFVATELLILRYPPILQFRPADASNLSIGRMVILANQAPSEIDGRDIRYLVRDCHANAEEMFGAPVIWAPQSPVVREAIAPYLNGQELLPYDIPGVLAAEKWFVERRDYRSMLPVIGRHSRDNEMKWPGDRSAIEKIYPTDGRADIRILGGASVPKAVLGTRRTPPAWTVYEQNQISPECFLASLDFYVFYQNVNAVEAFGRAVLEGIASGLVVVLPPHYERVFGAAAVYAEPDDAMTTVLRLYSNRSLYDSQIRRARRVIEDQFSHASHVRRIRELTAIMVNRG